MADLSPSAMRRIHATAAVLFVALWVLAAVVGWVNSPAFIAHMSMTALVYAALTGWQGARAEKKADENGD